MTPVLRSPEGQGIFGWAWKDELHLICSDVVTFFLSSGHYDTTWQLLPEMVRAGGRGGLGGGGGLPPGMPCPRPPCKPLVAVALPEGQCACKATRPESMPDTSGARSEQHQGLSKKPTQMNQAERFRRQPAPPRKSTPPSCPPPLSCWGARAVKGVPAVAHCTPQARQGAMWSGNCLAIHLHVTWTHTQHRTPLHVVHPMDGCLRPPVRVCGVEIIIDVP